METITIVVFRDDVYDEVAKATDYTGSKLIDADQNARDRILAADEDLASLGRFWDETTMAANENLKEMLISGKRKEISISGDNQSQAMDAGILPIIIKKSAYEAIIEVSKNFDKGLTESVEQILRSYFIASIIGYWFKFANKEEASDYFQQAASLMEGVERLLYSRRKPTRPRI